MWSLSTSSNIYSNIDLKSTLRFSILLRRANFKYSSTITLISNLSLISILIMNLSQFLYFFNFSRSPIPDFEADVFLSFTLKLYFMSICLYLIITSTAQINLIVSPIMLLIVSIFSIILIVLPSPIPDSDL